MAEDTHNTKPLQDKATVDAQMEALHERMKLMSNTHGAHYFMAFAGERYGERGPQNEAMFNIVSVMDGCTKCGLTGLAKMLVGSLSSEATAYFMERLVEASEQKISSESSLAGYKPTGLPN